MLNMFKNFFFVLSTNTYWRNVHVHIMCVNNNETIVVHRSVIHPSTTFYLIVATRIQEIIYCLTKRLNFSGFNPQTLK